VWTARKGSISSIVAKGARIALGELAAMPKATKAKGRGLVTGPDRRSRLGDVLNALLRYLVITARDLADSLRASHQTETATARVACFDPRRSGEGNDRSGEL
jgi:hypothetical protein